MHNKKHRTEEVVNRVLALIYLTYRTKYRKREGDMLWLMLQEDLEGINTELLKLGNRHAFRPIREHMVMHGVWMAMPKGARS
jgi:hypothetical protein